MNQNLNQPLNPHENNINQALNGVPPPHNMQNHAHRAPHLGQNPIVLPQPFELPPEAEVNDPNLPPAPVGVRNALIMDIVLALISAVGCLQTGITFNMLSQLGMVFNVLWLMLIILCFSSGYRQYPLKNPGVLTFYMTFRLVIYYITKYGSAIGAAICVCLAIFSFIYTGQIQGPATSNALVGLICLITAVVLLIFVGVGHWGIKLNNHFNRLLRGDRPRPVAPVANLVAV